MKFHFLNYLFYFSEKKVEIAFDIYGYDTVWLILEPEILALS